MTLEQFENLVLGQRRSISDGMAVKKGAYKPGEPATHMGKIVYPQCRTLVQPPSDWDPAIAEESAQVPNARLREWGLLPGLCRLRHL